MPRGPLTADVDGDGIADVLLDADRGRTQRVFRGTERGLEPTPVTIGE